MKKDKSFNSVWRALLIVGSIAAAVFAVDARYVTDSVFEEFKEGTVVSIMARLDSIEYKLDAAIASKKR